MRIAVPLLSQDTNCIGTAKLATRVQENRTKGDNLQIIKFSDVHSARASPTE